MVGAGISGLAVAFRLERARPDWDIVVFEAADAVGGKARTTVRDGYTVDWGPNGFVAPAPATLALIRGAGLEPELQAAAPAARRRYLYRDGGLRRLPTSPGAFLTSELVPWTGRLRAVAEVLLTSRSASEESVHAFLARHFGTRFATALADAFVSGIAAGDPAELSVDALFPRLLGMEREHGSLIRALIAGRRAAERRRRQAAGGDGRGMGPAAGGGLVSFRSGGMQRLLDGIRSALASEVRVGARVEALERLGGDAAGGSAEGGGSGGARGEGDPPVGGAGAGESAGHGASGHGTGPGGGGAAYGVRVAGAAPERFDEVVLAVPAYAAARLLRPHVPAAADALSAVPYAGVRVFGLGFDRAHVPRMLDGFGFLVPRGQGVRSLGVLWSSSLYPDRAPAGKVLLRVLAGGRLDPGMLELSESEALDEVRRDLRLTMGVVAEPEFVEAVTWPRAIPQYTLGHGERVRAAEAALASLPGVRLAGNAYRGVGINDGVRDAERVAAELLASG